MEQALISPRSSHIGGSGNGKQRKRSRQRPAKRFGGGVDCASARAIAYVDRFDDDTNAGILSCGREMNVWKCGYLYDFVTQTRIGKEQKGLRKECMVVGVANSLVARSALSY